MILFPLCKYIYTFCIFCVIYSANVLEVDVKNGVIKCYWAAQGIHYFSLHQYKCKMFVVSPYASIYITIVIIASGYYNMWLLATLSSSIQSWNKSPIVQRDFDGKYFSHLLMTSEQAASGVGCGCQHVQQWQLLLLNFTDLSLGLSKIVIVLTSTSPQIKDSR